MPRGGATNIVSMNAVSGLDIYLEIPARALEPGMFVAALDRPWEETPFALQGFNVQNRRDIEMVCRFCQTVRIDPARRVALAAPAATPHAPALDSHSHSRPVPVRTPPLRPQ